MARGLLRLPKPTPEDYLRSLGYLTIMVWAFLYLFFPTSTSVTSLEGPLRAFWMLITFCGASISLVGSLTRIDLKMELPGLLLTLIGPMFYFISQIYISSIPVDASRANDRTALIVYALLPGILLLPRTIALYIEARRLKRVNVSALEAVHFVE